ncbi:MAG: hypothetical protein IT236_03350, partial [Bacteroidia bacterium]|nr:hypothetical protein [Bacteroidia bacterium]
MLKRIYNKGLSILNDAIGVVQLFCERKGITAPVQARHFRLVKNSVLVQHAYPVNFKESDKALFSHYSNYQSQNEEIFLLNNVNISESGIVFKGFNNFGDAFPHTVFRTQYGWLYILRHYLFCKKINPETQPVYILLYDFWSAGNYYHWLVDALPRLAIVKQELEDKGHS